MEAKLITNLVNTSRLLRLYAKDERSIATEDRKKMLAASVQLIEISKVMLKKEKEHITLLQNTDAKSVHAPLPRKRLVYSLEKGWIEKNI